MLLTKRGCVKDRCVEEMNEEVFYGMVDSFKHHFNIVADGHKGAGKENHSPFGP